MRPNRTTFNSLFQKKLDSLLEKLMVEEQLAIYRSDSFASSSRNLNRYQKKLRRIKGRVLLSDEFGGAVLFWRRLGRATRPYGKTAQNGG